MPFTLPFVINVDNTAAIAFMTLCEFTGRTRLRHIHRNLELCKTLKTTTEQFSLFSTEQFGGLELNPEHVASPTPGAGRRHTGVGAISRCPRIEKASMYHVLHATSEEPPRISRSCLGWVRRVLRSCDDATGRITALCATHGNM